MSDQDSFPLNHLAWDISAPEDELAVSKSDAPKIVRYANDTTTGKKRKESH